MKQIHTEFSNMSGKEVPLDHQRGNPKRGTRGSCFTFLTVNLPLGRYTGKVGHSGTNRFTEKAGNSEKLPFADHLVSKQPLHFCIRFAF